MILPTPIKDYYMKYVKWLNMGIQEYLVLVGIISSSAFPFWVSPDTGIRM